MSWAGLGDSISIRQPNPSWMLDPPGFKYDLFWVLPGFTAHRPNDLPQEVDPHFPGEIMLSIMSFSAKSSWIHLWSQRHTWDCNSYRAGYIYHDKPVERLRAITSTMSVVKNQQFLPGLAVSMRPPPGLPPPVPTAASLAASAMAQAAHAAALAAVSVLSTEQLRLRHNLGS